MKKHLLPWTPVVLLAAGAILVLGIDLQRPLALAAPLDSSVPRSIGDYKGEDVSLSEGERRISGVTDYLMRVYVPEDSTASAITVYVGFYDQQSQGKTIHSPKNCLPGSGWTALRSQTERIESDGRSVSINRYILQRDEEQALVLYWYQGRGRVQASEYAVKWNLLRDSAIRGRSDEALVRIVVPITNSEEDAFARASEFATIVLPAVEEALPR